MPELEAAATIDFSPLATVESFETREIRRKHLPATSSGAAVAGYSSVPPSDESLGSPAKSSELLVRDPNTFRAGEIHNHPEVWGRLSAALPNNAETMSWKIWLENFALCVSDIGHGGHARVASPAHTLFTVY